MKKIYILFPVIILLLLSACRQDEENENTIIDSYVPPIIENYAPEVKPVTSSVDGQVQDSNQRPIENATVRLGNLSTLTNKYGLFSFENVTMNEKGTFITVSQNQYLNGSRRFFPKEGINNKIVIEMLTEDFQSSFDAATGGNIIINGTTGVNFPANSIVNANGEVYEGDVFTTYAYLDPTANTTADRMPGNLQGVRTDLAEVSLQSYGMINVSLQDANGAPLNIGEGFTATISVALPNSIAANAPNEIPLWSFNEDFGIWVEEGSATKVNGHYVGEVKHFSWWNCDAPFPLVELDVTLTDDDGNPVANHIVAIGFGSDSLANYYAYTNADGFISGKVPAGEELILQIRGLCGDIIYSEFIGPFSDNTSKIINVEDSSVNDTEITGSLVDCNGDIVANGGVLVTIDDLDYFSQLDEGSFNFFISTCSEAIDLTVRGFDLDENVESEPFIGVTGTMINTGELMACGNVTMENRLTVNVGNETYGYVGDDLRAVDFGDTIGIIIFYEPVNSQETNISFLADGNTVGNYDDDGNYVDQFYDLSTDFPYSLSSVDTTQAALSFSTFNITQVSPNIIGNFSGIAINNAGNTPDTVIVSGDFNILQ